MFKNRKKSYSLLLLIGAVLMLSSCSSTLDPPEHIVNIQIDSRNDTNAGRLMYMTIRTVNRKAFLMEKYEDASRRVFADPPDPTVLTQKVIFPGEIVSLTLDDKKQDMAIYCFFTTPGKSWKSYIPFNPKTDNHYIRLSANDILSVSNYKPYFTYLDYLNIFNYFK